VLCCSCGPLVPWFVSFIALTVVVARRRSFAGLFSGPRAVTGGKTRIQRNRQPHPDTKPRTAYDLFVLDRKAKYNTGNTKERRTLIREEWNKESEAVRLQYATKRDELKEAYYLKFPDKRPPVKVTKASGTLLVFFSPVCVGVGLTRPIVVCVCVLLCLFSSQPMPHSRQKETQNTGPQCPKETQNQLHFVFARGTTTFCATTPRHESDRRHVCLGQTLEQDVQRRKAPVRRGVQT